VSVGLHAESILQNPTVSPEDKIRVHVCLCKCAGDDDEALAVTATIMANYRLVTSVASEPTETT
jgi:hypothetical protein